MKRASKLRRENWMSQLMTSIALNVDSTLIIWFYTIKILFYILSWCCLFSPPLHLATKVISYNLMHWFMCICQHTQAKHTDWNYLFYRLFRLLLRYHLSISRLLCHCCSHCSSYNNSTRKNEVVVRPANNPLLVIFQHYFLSSSFGGLHSLSSSLEYDSLAWSRFNVLCWNVVVSLEVRLCTHEWVILSFFFDSN